MDVSGIVLVNALCVLKQIGAKIFVFLSLTDREVFSMNNSTEDMSKSTLHNQLRAVFSTDYIFLSYAAAHMD